MSGEFPPGDASGAGEDLLPRSHWIVIVFLGVGVGVDFEFWHGLFLQRPDGVVLATEIRTGSAREHEKGGAEIENLTVYKVEEVDLADSLFAIPDSYEPAGPR